MSGENYITVMGWMVKELGLKGNDLLVYALVHGFSQNGEGCYYGSIADTADWIGATRPTVLASLKKLLAVGLVEKQGLVIDGQPRCAYRVVKKYAQSKNLPGKISLPGVIKNFSEGSKDFLPGTSDIKDNNKYIYNNTLDARTREGVDMNSSSSPRESRPEAVARITDEFRRTVMQYADRYAPSMLEAFVTYWTEPYRNPIGNKLVRFQGERTWSLEGRLRMWAARDASRARSAYASKSSAPQYVKVRTPLDDAMDEDMKRMDEEIMRERDLAAAQQQQQPKQGGQGVC